MPVLVDSNILLDIFTEDRHGCQWSANTLAELAERTTPLPDFYIGAHAAIKSWSILTRDKGRYQSYFPSLQVMAP